MRRAVEVDADSDGQVPVSAQLQLAVDGNEVAPGDLAGRTGQATVRLRVRNTTAQRQTLTWQHDDQRQDRPHRRARPMLGQITTFGDGWVGVEAPSGSVATDADATTTVRWVTVLFEPFGSLSQEMAATATVAGRPAEGDR